MAPLQDRVIQIVDRYRKELEKEIRVQRMVLFGSWARGDADERSDIDVAVVSPDLGDVGRSLSILARARVRVSTLISPLAFTPQQWDHSEPTSIVAELREVGRIIYERAG